MKATSLVKFMILVAALGSLSLVSACGRAGPRQLPSTIAADGTVSPEATTAKKPVAEKKFVLDGLLN
ncbi:MAG: hypothetical protein U5K75_01390 [Ahrensia sp.]|nr:hypothetical protein [Ahrensia sp.]